MKPSFHRRPSAAVKDGEQGRQSLVETPPHKHVEKLAPGGRWEKETAELNETVLSTFIGCLRRLCAFTTQKQVFVGDRDLIKSAPPQGHFRRETSANDSVYRRIWKV